MIAATSLDGDIHVTSALLDRGAMVDATVVCSCDRFLSPWLWSKLERVPPGQQTDGLTALQLACEESQLATVICLLDHGASLDHTDVRHVHCGVALLCSLFAHVW